MANLRVGLGIDFHRFARGRKLVLGGVEIAHPLGLAGHSDADVVLHAICDALLGAAAVGDIGRHFPPGDPRFKDIPSLTLLAQTKELVARAGFRPVQVDATVIAEEPKIAPYAEAMRARIAATLGLPPAHVSIKATTPEQMGALGRKEGIAALAVAVIETAA